jgi:cobalt-zinc-cadmium efflux system outer membrane protein
MRTTTVLPLLFLALALRFTEAAESGRENAAPARLSLGEVTRSVLAANPAIAEARRQWEAARERVTQEKAWADLRVGVNSAIARFVNIAPNAFTDQSLSIEQEIPISGKNRSRARIAAVEAVIAFEYVRRTQLDAVARARASYFRLANAHAQIELNRENYTSLTQIAEVSRARYAVGTQSAADVLVAETEAARLLERGRDLERDLAAEQSQLNVLMNRDAFAPLGVPAENNISGAAFSIGALRALTIAQRPEVRAAAARVEAEKARLQLAHRAWIPDPTIVAHGQRYNDTGQAVSEVGAGISFGIPWGNYRKYSAGVSEARASREAAAAALDRAEKEAIGQLRNVLQKVETAHHHVEFCSGELVPRAKQAFEANQFSYEAGKASFLDWIGAQRRWRELQAESRDHLAEYQAAIAELEAVVGADLKIFPKSTQAPGKESK